MADVAPPKTLQSIHFLCGLASLLVVLIHALGPVTLKFPGHPTVLPRSFQDSLYLSHSISLALFFKVVVMWGLVRWLPVDMLIPLALLVAVLGGRVIYLTCEKPLTRFLNAVWRKSKPVAQLGDATAPLCVNRTFEG